MRFKKENWICPDCGTHLRGAVATFRHQIKHNAEKVYVTNNGITNKIYLNKENKLGTDRY